MPDRPDSNLGSAGSVILSTHGPRVRPRHADAPELHLQTSRRRSPRQILPRRRVRRSNRASRACSPTRAGFPPGTRSRRRRAAWAAGSASGCSAATTTGRSRCSRSSFQPAQRHPCTTHLAWGLVGLYRGTQDEEIYARSGSELRLVESRALEPGDFYALIPPTDDIHRVRTTSPETSVSIHLLTNDTGCVWRHAYDEHTGKASPFRSGYVNVACDDPGAGDH
jgi:hypothetical protein